MQVEIDVSFLLQPSWDTKLQLLVLIYQLNFPLFS